MIQVDFRMDNNRAMRSICAAEIIGIDILLLFIYALTYYAVFS